MQGACRVLCFPPPPPPLPIPCLCSQLFRSSSWVFDLFNLVHNLSCCTHVQLFLVPYSFFVFCCSGDVCPGVSPAAKGPRFQPVFPGPSPPSGITCISEKVALKVWCPLLLLPPPYVPSLPPCTGLRLHPSTQVRAISWEVLVPQP